MLTFPSVSNRYIVTMGLSVFFHWRFFLQHAIQTALVDKVVEDFLDIATPLKQLTDCVVQPPPPGLDRDRIFDEKAENLSRFSDRIVRTAKMVAVGTGTGNKKVAEALLATAGQASP